MFRDRKLKSNRNGGKTAFLFHCEHLRLWEAGMQKKMHQQCHCEGAVGDCGNLKPNNTKTVYFLRRPLGRSNLKFSQKRDCRARLSYGVLTDCLAHNDLRSMRFQRFLIEIVEIQRGLWYFIRTKSVEVFRILLCQIYQIHIEGIEP